MSFSSGQLGYGATQNKLRGIDSYGLLSANLHPLTQSNGGIPNGPGGNPNHAWFPFFGFNQALVERNPHDAYNEETKNMPQAYDGKKSPYLSKILIDEVSYAEQFMLRDIFPIKEHTDSIVVAWDVWKFNNHMLDRTPEQSVSRLLTSNVASYQETMTRYGIGLLLEHGFMKTARGVRNYLANLQQIVNATLMTMIKGAVMAALYVDWRGEGGQDDHIVGDVFPNEYVAREAINRELSHFFIYGKGNWQLLNDEEIGRFQRRTGIKPNVQIVGQNVLKYIKNYPTHVFPMSDMQAPSIGKTEEQARARKSGLSIFEFPMIRLGDEHKSENLAEQEKCIADFFKFDTSHLDGMPAADYQAIGSVVAVMDRDHDKIVKMQYAEAIAKCGLFVQVSGGRLGLGEGGAGEVYGGYNTRANAAGVFRNKEEAQKPEWRLTGLGSSVFRDYGTWGEYMRDRKLMDPWLKSLSGKGDSFVEVMKQQDAKQRGDGKDDSLLSRFKRAIIKSEPLALTKRDERFAKEVLMEIDWDDDSAFTPALRNAFVSALNAAVAADADDADGGESLPASPQPVAAPSTSAQFAFDNLTEDLLRRPEFAPYANLRPEGKYVSRKAGIKAAGLVLARGNEDRVTQGFSREDAIPVFGAGSETVYISPAALLDPVDGKSLLPDAITKVIGADNTTAAELAAAVEVARSIRDEGGAATIDPNQAMYRAFVNGLANIAAEFESDAAATTELRTLQEELINARITAKIGGGILYRGSYGEAQRLLALGQRDQKDVKVPASKVRGFKALYDDYTEEIDDIYSRRLAHAGDDDDQFSSPEQFVRIMTLIQAARDKRAKMKGRNVAIATDNTRDLLNELYHGTMLKLCAALSSYSDSKALAAIERSGSFLTSVRKVFGQRYLTLVEKSSGAMYQTFLQDRMQENHPSVMSLMEKTRAAEYDDTALSIEGALDALDINDATIVFFSAENDLWPLVDVVGFRMAIRYLTSPTVTMLGYGAAGTTWRGEHSFELGDDPLRKIHFGHFTIYTRSVVHEKSYIQHANSTMVHRYLGGGGVKVWDLSRPEHRDAFNQGVKACDILYMGTLAGDKDLHQAEILDVTGRMHPGFGTFGRNPLSRKATPEAGPAYAEKLHLQHGDNPLQQHPFIDGGLDYNTMAFQTMQQNNVYEGKGRWKQQARVTHHRGHEGQDFGYEGSMKPFNGQAMYLQTPWWSQLKNPPVGGSGSGLLYSTVS